MAFLYLDKELQPYTKIEERMRSVLSKIAAKATAPQQAEPQSVPTEASQPGIDTAENNAENQQ